MDKETYCLILECALLLFDGVTLEELQEKYGFSKGIA